jgi:hypothetical protein
MYNFFDSNIGDVKFGSQQVSQLLTSGNPWFVNETTGSDSNPGSSPQEPFKTLTAALAAATANNNDVVYFIGSVHVSATVAWNKNGVSLVGLNGPSGNNRARISQTGSTVFTPLVNVTAAGCQFINVGTFHGFNSDTAQICWTDAGGRNYYQACNFLGMGDATAAANAGGRSLLLSGSTGENLFDSCIIGLDTVVRATGNTASLEITGGSPRNIFQNCIFRALSTNAANVHVLIGADGIDRNCTFKRCVFTNAVDTGGTAMNAAFSVNAAGGSVILDPACISVGATAIAAAGPVYGAGGALGATTWGIGIKLT